MCLTTARGGRPTANCGDASLSALLYGSAIVALLTIQAVLLAYSATCHSPTELEPAFLASGIAHWKFGRFEPYRVNPPFVRMLAAIPVVVVGYQGAWKGFETAPGTRSEFVLGAEFVKANGDELMHLFAYARWACIPFSLMASFFAYKWARELYGAAAGLVTLTLFVFEPNLLAHGELITCDGACTAFGIVAGYSFWRWLKQPTWVRALLAGGALGLAELSKMSWLLLFGVWPILWLTWRFVEFVRAPILEERRGRLADPAGETATSRGASSDVDYRAGASNPPFRQFVVIPLTAVYLINLAYSFDGTGKELRSFQFVSKTLSGQSRPGQPGNRFEKQLIGQIPVLLPEQYLLGFDNQKKDFEAFHYPSYLRGEWCDHGWWYYYLYGLWVKVPCGTWGLLALVVVSRLARKVSGVRVRDEVVLIVPGMALLLLVSSQTEFNIHLRYVLPSLGLMLIFLGQVGTYLQSLRNVFAILVLILIGYSLASGMATYPHHLAYFNDFVGGPKNGDKHLLGSSLDWGQSIHEAINWIREHKPSLPVEICVSSRAVAATLIAGTRGAVRSTDSPAVVPRLILYSADEYSKRQKHWKSTPLQQSERIIAQFASGTKVALVVPFDDSLQGH